MLPLVELLPEDAVEAAPELVLLVVPVVVAVVAVVVAVVVAAVLAAVVLLEALDELAGWSSTNCVRAESSALNSLPPPCCVEVVLLALLPLESSSLCRRPSARCVPNREERLNVAAFVLVLTAVVDIMCSL